MSRKFEWDHEKAESNLAKHGVTFFEAMSVFRDKLSIRIVDTEHSDEELRYALVGMSSRLRLLVVVYTLRPSRIRIISARRATKNERRNYEELD